MSAAAPSSTSADAKADDFPRLVRLAAAAACRNWLTSRTSLEGVPADLSKLVWKEVRALLKRHGKTVRCADMYPFVRASWRVEALDLTDGGKWLTDASLGALGSIATLRSVRLTGCRFIGDEGLAFLSRVPLETLDVSWTEVGDGGLAAHVTRCRSLTSLNLTGLARVSDAGISALLSLTSLQRLSLASTSISDAALDYLTYYSRYPGAGPPEVGVHALRRLELSNTRLTDVGVGKLVAVIEDGTPYGKVFKDLEYLALSSTQGVGPAAIRQVRTKYGFDAPLPNAQRTLAKSNSVALDAQSWVLRFAPTDRALPTPSRTWEQERVVAYIAQYTKEMAAAVEVIRMLTAADHAPPPPPAEGPEPKRARNG